MSRKQDFKFDLPRIRKESWELDVDEFDDALNAYDSRLGAETRHAWRQRPIEKSRAKNNIGQDMNPVELSGHADATGDQDSSVNHDSISHDSVNHDSLHERQALSKSTTVNSYISSDDESGIETLVYETDLQFPPQESASRFLTAPPHAILTQDMLSHVPLDDSQEQLITPKIFQNGPPKWIGKAFGQDYNVTSDRDIVQSFSDGDNLNEGFRNVNNYNSKDENSKDYDDESIRYELNLDKDAPSFPSTLSSEKQESQNQSNQSLNIHDNFNPKSFVDLVDNSKSLVIEDEFIQSQARNFVMEHRIFIKSLMSLLEQRDMIAVDMDNPNTLKCGPLKKATHLVKGAWKVKYVEIRRGVFSYYDDCLSKDAASEGNLIRKNVRLHAHKCICRAVKLNHKSLTLVPGQAIFELTIEGSPRRFWMTNSREERAAWIRAIHDAMIGGAITRDELHMDHVGRVGKVSRKSPYKRDLDLYLKVQRDVRNASSKQAYIGALSHIIGSTLNVPVKWITEQIHLSAEETEQAFREDAVTTGVNQLWKDLERDTVRVNGELISGGSGQAPERIMGAVTRYILKMDRSSPLRPADPEFVWKGVTELQAISFARDILLSCNRTRSGGDSYYCVDALTNHPGMVILVPSSLEAEPLTISVEHYQQSSQRHRQVKQRQQQPLPSLDPKTHQESHRDRNTYSESYSLHDRGGWLRTRTRHDSKWKRLYFVLSAGTLSMYRKGDPRPYGLEAQLKVAETQMYVAKLKTKLVSDNSNGEKKSKNKSFILTTKGREGIWERQIYFNSEDKFLIWAFAFEEEIAKHMTLDSPRRNLNFFNMLAQNRDDKTSSNVGFLLSLNSLQDNAALLDLDGETIASRAKALALQFGVGKKQSTVAVLVRAATTYKICTVDPQGNDSEDTWATVRATFLQHFGISGGPNGIMNRSEEVVQIEILECSSAGLGFQVLSHDSGLSPRALAETLSRKLRRKESQKTGETRSISD